MHSDMVFDCFGAAGAAAAASMRCEELLLLAGANRRLGGGSCDGVDTGAPAPLRHEFTRPSSPNRFRTSLAASVLLCSMTRQEQCGETLILRVSPKRLPPRTPSLHMRDRFEALGLFPQLGRVGPTARRGRRPSMGSSALLHPVRAHLDARQGIAGVSSPRAAVISRACHRRGA